ncbi:TOTE conflict system archaeo-eukaryotic primase domain-containing protein [Thiohalocapsa halophila]|uniref:TOTE conflict system archaeo-eukaryotic primase domain-containing protein n=1 Tax=Thiohalocapsa halophila TaxID=69359 RepID=UPI002ADE4882|nr:DEAD/DEAH box helicase family protein [Thiohalocapsa halophila]
MSEQDALAALRAENARLIGLLEAHGIQWRQPTESLSPVSERETQGLSTREKVALFRRLFRGRDDVFPIRWESKTSGKSGYAPACANEWRSGVCDKPRIKCADCAHRVLIPLTDTVVYDHLAGKHTIGIYPLLEDDTCHFLAVDFDKADWRADARAFAQSCEDLGVPVALEISRSGQGAHAWIFFDGRVPAHEARRLGTTLISHTCARTRQLELTSYDRLFPSQDRLPKGGFGNLIALPLQKQPRESQCSLFVDSDWHAYPDQWAFLASIRLMAPQDIEPAILRGGGGVHPLDIAFIDEEDQAEPWKRPKPAARALPAPMPKRITMTLADRVYFEKAQLPQPLANRLIRLAAFQNPAFYRAQAMRLSVWNKPRVIGCAENYPQHIALPRGCLDAVLELLQDNAIGSEVHDERSSGRPLEVEFAGTLRSDQAEAVSAMLQQDTGVLCAPTAFGKTVVAAGMIAERRVNTLVLVHRTDLLNQWRERLQSFLGVGQGVIGTIGGGKTKLSGKIDLAVMQSLSRRGKVNPCVEDYGQVIVDECHHLGATSFEDILKCVKARYVLGLTATPIRRDGQQPIIFMQCGPIRHTATQPAGAPRDLAVLPRELSGCIDLPPDAGIQEVFRHLANDQDRTKAIIDPIHNAVEHGRKVLVLTERTDHVHTIHAALEGTIPSLFVLHGRMSKKQRAALVAELDALAPDAPRVLVATGKLVGEGFDHPPLDTLVLAMPVSWRGTLQQYAGRLHREHAIKTDVRIIDFIDTGHPALQRMWDKRQRGYQAMGYRIADQPELDVR